jgi:hypothetical protein
MMLIGAVILPMENTAISSYGVRTDSLKWSAEQA